MLKTKLILAVMLAMPLLAGCGTLFKRPDPQPPIKENVYVPVAVPDSFYSPTACPSWPSRDETVVNGDDQEGSDYTLRGYEAYRCERNTRLSAGERSREIEADVEARNQEKKPD